MRIRARREISEQEREREESRARNEESAVSVSRAEAARDRRDGDHDERAGSDGEAGLERRVAPDVREKEDGAEEHRGEGASVDERREVRVAEARNLEERHVERGRFH